MGRRVRKQVFLHNGTDWNPAPESEKLFVYEGWNVVKETAVTGGAPSEKYYVWGPDLSQSVQGAGGIGGLLCSSENGTVLYYFYDGNGNVSQLVNAADGSIAAHYEYDAFGNLINSYGAYADENPFRFSTKYFDAETGLYYYGFRYYSPEIGRWLNRDPIGEEGGINLNSFIGNNPFYFYDYLGLFPPAHQIYGRDGSYWKPKYPVKMEGKSLGLPRPYYYYPKPPRNRQRKMPAQPGQKFQGRMEDWYDWDEERGRWQPYDGKWNDNGSWSPDIVKPINSISKEDLNKKQC
ncbi:MAG: RHS repeat domain-containing protein [Desulfococcaceae bacterium]